MGIRIDCGFVYSSICNMMMWHVRIERVKLGFYTISLYNLILIKKCQNLGFVQVGVC